MNCFLNQISLRKLVLTDVVNSQISFAGNKGRLSEKHSRQSPFQQNCKIRPLSEMYFVT